MANIKKLNGYNIIDSNFEKITGTINSLVLDEEGQPASNYVEMNIPDGWNITNTFICGGYYQILDGDTVILTRKINSVTTDITTGDITSSCEVDFEYEQSKILGEFVNYISDYVGYNVVFHVLIYYKP